jgi:hypothetical protein
MTIEEAKKQLGNRAQFELVAMKKALTTLGGWFNDDEDNKNLEAIMTLEKEKSL